ncbi:ATP-binding cassette domain-containing protein [Mariniluteicoccus flavus]
MTDLRAHLVHKARGVDVEVDVPAGHTLAIVGPNGAGKSTVLGGIVGTVPPDPASVVTLGGRDVTAVPVHRRRIALLGQDPLLFPHLTLLDNVAFGPRAAGVRVPEARAVAAGLLDLVGIAELASRRPCEVSGGQAQRAALARALATEPDLLLLDEPLAALDAEVAPALRQVLRPVLAGRTAVVVTHDLLDALALADEVAVVEAGRVVERGPATDVLARPTSAFGARFAGVNLVSGTARDGVLIAGGTSLHGLGDTTGRAVALFRPAAVAVHGDHPGGSPRNAFAVTVTALEAHGSGVRVVTSHADLGRVAADITAAAAAELELRPGGHAWLAVKAQEVELVSSAGAGHGTASPHP